MSVEHSDKYGEFDPERAQALLDKINEFVAIGRYRTSEVIAATSAMAGMAHAIGAKLSGRDKEAAAGILAESFEAMKVQFERMWEKFEVKQ